VSRTSLKWNPALFGYQTKTGDDTTFDERDSAPFVPKCIVVDPEFVWRGQGRLVKYRVPFDDTIIYEMHAKGFTKLHPSVPHPHRN
jgi:isoamylase